MKGKQQKSPPAVEQRRVSDEGGKIVDRKLLGMSPGAAQKACMPTEAEAMRMHYKLAGGC